MKGLALLMSLALVLVVIVAIKWAAALPAPDPWPTPGVPHGPGVLTWDLASRGDCDLLALSLRGMKTEMPTNDLPLWSSDGPGICEKVLAGLHRGRLTKAQFEATRPYGRDGRYIAHIILTAPLYSPSHLRASVAVGSEFGTLAAVGDTCRFRWTFRGWRLESCRQVWVS